MSDFITLACPSCGGSLRVTTDAGRFACKYCSREHIVRNQNGIVTVTPVLEKLDRIASGVGRHASELAIPRLRKEIGVLRDKIDDCWRRVEEWEDWRDRNSPSTVTWVVLFAVFGPMLALCAGIFHWAAAVLIVLGAIVATACVFIYGKNKREKVCRAAYLKIEAARDRIAELRRAVEQRLDELDRHRENVRI